METTILSLVKQYKEKGNEEYFVELVKRFQPLIKTYAYKLYYLEYEDSMQELTLALYEAIMKMPRADNEYGCITYIEKAVVHKFCKLYYESVAEQKKQQSSICSDFDQLTESCTDYELQNCVYKMDIENYLKNKSELERNIIILISYGYSDEEIGRKLGYSRQYINRLKKKILNSTP